MNVNNITTEVQEHIATLKQLLIQARNNGKSPAPFVIALKEFTHATEKAYIEVYGELPTYIAVSNNDN